MITATIDVNHVRFVTPGIKLKGIIIPYAIKMHKITTSGAIPLDLYAHIAVPVLSPFTSVETRAYLSLLFGGQPSSDVLPISAESPFYPFLSKEEENIEFRHHIR